MNMTRTMSVLASLLLAAAVEAQALRPDLRLTSWGRPPLEGETLVYFLGEPLRFQADLAWRDSSIVPDTSLAQWWSKLRVTVSDSAGVVRTVNGADLQILEATVKGKLVAGTPQALGPRLPGATSVVFTIGVLPPGSYAVRAEAELESYALRSFEEKFAVRRGDEDRATRRLYLRKVAGEASSFEAYKDVQLELMKLEPENASILADIADRSLNVAAPVETRQWFRRASEARVAYNRAMERKLGVALSPGDREQMQANLERLQSFERLYDAYVERRGELELVPFTSAGKSAFAWHRPGRGIVGLADPEHPETIRPLPRVR